MMIDAKSPSLLSGQMWLDLKARATVHQQRDGGHHLARRAEAALERIVIDESLLDRMEFAVLSETLDRRYLHTLGGRGENHTSVHAPSVQMHRARAALAEVTALLGPRQPQILA